MISNEDPTGTPPDEGGKSPSAYAMTDPHYLPRMRKFRPVRIGFKVCDTNADIHSMSVDLLDQVVFLRPRLKMNWRWPFFNFEWESIREVICSRNSRVDNRGNPVNCTGGVWLLPLKDVDPQLVMSSAVNTFSPTHSQVREESGGASHRTTETGGSGDHTIRLRFLPRLFIGLSLMLVGIVGAISMFTGEPVAEPQARLVSIGDLVMSGEPSLPDGDQADVAGTLSATFIGDSKSVARTDCEPYDPEGMTWYRYSKQTGTEGQLVVTCGQDDQFTTSGFHRDSSGDKVYDNLRPYTY